MSAVAMDTVLATSEFRREHDELSVIAFDIERTLYPHILASAAGASSMRARVERFSAKLHEHVEHEKGVYPALLCHDDASVRDVARALFDEQTALFAMFADYAMRWTAEAIAQKPASFVRDTRNLMKRMDMRMVRETNELYPLVDAR